MSSVTQVYLVEIADSERRGWIGGSGALSVSAGITVVYIFGATMSWRWVSFSGGLLAILIAVIMPLLPETPNWLIMKDKRDRAYKSLKWLRGKDADVEEEMRALSAKLVSPSGQASREEALMNQMTKPVVYKPFMLLITLFVLMQSTGTFAIIFYAVNVFKDVGVTGNSYIAAIITGLLRMLGTLGGTILLQKTPRRKLLISSGILMGFALLALSGTIFYVNKAIIPSLKSEGNELELNMVFQGVIVILIVIYMLAFGLGLGTVPWLLLGELCPSQVKGLTSGVVTCMAFLTIFVVVKTFPYCVQSLETYGTYCIFGAICILTSLFSYFFVPETKGKSMAELQSLFESKSVKSEESVALHSLKDRD